MKAIILYFLFAALLQTSYSSDNCIQFGNTEGSYKVNDYSEGSSRSVGSIKVRPQTEQMKEEGGFEIISDPEDPLDETSYAKVDLLGDARIDLTESGCEITFIQDTGNIRATFSIVDEEIQISLAPQVTYGLR